MTEDELRDRIIVGKLKDDDKPEYVSALHKITDGQVAKMRGKTRG
jgi:hypothetical protein